MVEKEFKINEYITLRLELGDSNIYVCGVMFIQCKYLLINIPTGEISSYDEIRSIDDVAEMLNQASEGRFVDDIPSDTEFWGHCSNIQAWVENDYDTRILHSNIAFPLLKRLTEVGDPKAKKIFKDEIIHRINEGNLNVVKFLALEKYLDFFSSEEIEDLMHSLKDPKVYITILGVLNKAYSEFHEFLDELIKNIELAILGMENNAPEDFYIYFDDLQINIELAKWGTQNNAPEGFYNHFYKVSENPELARWGVLHRAPGRFYYYLNSLTTNIELAKWGVLHDAPWDFYKTFDDVKDNIELARWGIQNNAPEYFFLYFDKVKAKPELARWGVLHKAPWTFYCNLDSFGENINLARLGVLNKAPLFFYNIVGGLNENIKLARWAVQNNAPYEFFENYHDYSRCFDQTIWNDQNIHYYFEKIKDDICNRKDMYLDFDLKPVLDGELNEIEPLCDTCDMISVCLMINPEKEEISYCPFYANKEDVRKTRR